MAILTFRSGRRVVLRGFGDPAKSLRYTSAMDYCRGKTLPVPSLLATDTGWRTRLRFGQGFCIEEFIEGAVYAHTDRTPAQAEAVVRAVASIHSETAPYWGPIRRGSMQIRNPRSYREYLRKHVGRLIRDIAKQGGLSADPVAAGEPAAVGDGQNGERAPLASFVSLAELEGWGRWFEERIHAMEEPGAFNLAHHHLAADDVMIAPDNATATLLDNGSLQFGNFVQDVEDALAFLAPHAPEWRARLLTLYMERQTHLPADADYDAASEVFRAERHLKRLRRSARRRSVKPQDKEDAVFQNVEALRAVIDGTA
ncbi:MAG TPA: hypothetical protein VM492_10465 [Sumerlaeia bacterium]|nr:hypothetical protein [Sumerlaeia bacterium]